MSADDEAYDSLGRILAQGGLRSARAGLEKHAPGPLFTAWLATRFPGLRPTEVDQLSHLATQYRTAGQLLKQVQPGATLDDSAIPVAPTLFGAEPLGRRYQVLAVAKVYNVSDDSFAYSTVSVEYATMPTADQIWKDISLTAGGDALSTLPAGTSLEQAITDIIEIDYRGVVRVF